MLYIYFFYFKKKNTLPFNVSTGWWVDILYIYFWFKKKKKQTQKWKYLSAFQLADEEGVTAADDTHTALPASSGDTEVLVSRCIMATAVDFSTHEGTRVLKYSEIVFKLSLDRETNQVSLFGNFLFFGESRVAEPLTIFSFSASLETDRSRPPPSTTSCNWKYKQTHVFYR